MRWKFIDGETVDAYVKRKGLLDAAEALGITLQVSRALAAADKEKLVHRDLKPSNLMLVEEDDEKVVKVIDFGLAKSTQGGGESSGTLTVGGFVGTPHFASPEQLEERDIDIRSDIYSLGATLYYMLAGRPPYSGSVAQIMSQHLYKPPPMGPLDGFPPCVVELIQRMMEKDPAKRPQRPVDLRREILPCLERLQASATGGISARAIPTVSGCEARASYLRMLSLLVYELLGGQRNSIESTGRYSPVASLSERGNELLRRGLIDDFRSATELALELGGEIVARNIDPVTTMPVSMSSPGSSAVNLSSGMPISPSQPAPPIDDAGQPPSATSLTVEQTRHSVVGLIPGLILVAGIGLGGYLFYQLFIGALSAKKGQSANSVAQASALPMVLASATPNRDVVVSPSAEAGAAAPNRAALAGPSVEVSTQPSREVLTSPTTEPSAAPNQEAPAVPGVEASATPSQEALASQSAEASVTPSREVLASPSPGAVATARLEPTATPDSRMAGSQSQTMRNSSAADNYPDKLAAAQRLIDNGDWSGALQAYVALIEQYPERPAASRSLENFLTDWSANGRKQESLAQLKPDLMRAAEDGILQAMLIVARSSQETDRVAALKWYEAAASKGSVEGMKKAGDLLYSNHKRPDDDLKAVNYFVQAASTGDPEAEYLSGECYFFGKGAMPDIDKAMQFLQEAAAQRYTKAMDLLGTCYRKQRKFQQARQSYEEAAAAGYALSFYNLGVLYMNGEGVSRSPKKAEDQFRRSAELSKENAEKGDIISMFYYAGWLEQGIGVAKDAKAASEWFRRSARAGYAPAIDWCKRNGAVP